MSAGARLIYGLINETAVTPNNWALPTASQPACYQLVPSLCLHCILHSCAWVGSQLDRDPAQIYAPVYLSALETICGEDAFEAAEPAAARLPQEDGRSRSPSLTRSSPCETGTVWGWGTNAALTTQRAQGWEHRWSVMHLEVERPMRGDATQRGAGSASYCRRVGSCYVLPRGNEISRDTNCLEKITQELTSSQTSLPTVANAP